VIVLDASALIAFLNRSDALHERAVASLLALGPQPFAISPITYAEILVGPTRAGRLDRTRAALATLGVAETALPADAAPRLARLRLDTSLKLPDCCVILAAQQGSASILTFDDGLVSAARRLKIGLADRGPDG
jgi:predicted nucleic acid-binding protein